VHHQGAHASRLRDFQRPLHRLPKHGWTDALLLMTSIDGQAARQHHRHRLGGHGGFSRASPDRVTAPVANV
jgi:hypothetical protein